MTVRSEECNTQNASFSSLVIVTGCLGGMFITIDFFYKICENVKGFETMDLTVYGTSESLSQFYLENNRGFRIALFLVAIT